LWELDHVTPLIDGGSHDFKNLQTLCTPCHKHKTAKEARNRAAQRQQLKEDEILEAAEAVFTRSESLLEEIADDSD
jgi:5-methylcytosine-specific restriction endonuclease McrA